MYNPAAKFLLKINEVILVRTVVVVPGIPSLRGRLLKAALNISFRKIVSLEKERQITLLSKGIGKQIPKI